MGFDFNYTCPSIDDSIEDLKNSITNHISDILEEHCPMISDEDKENVINEYTESIYKDMSYYFEDVRDSNRDIRDAAEKQIEAYEDEIEDLKSNIDDLEDELSNI